MGYLERIREQQRLYKKTILSRIIRGTVAVLLIPVFVPLLFFRESYKANKWPWEVL